jgi:hypothetical protein
MTYLALLSTHIGHLKLYEKNCDFTGFYTTFQNKVIKLATSRLRRFLGRCLWQHFSENVTAQLGQSPFTAVDAR